MTRMHSRARTDAQRANAQRANAQRANAQRANAQIQRMKGPYQNLLDAIERNQIDPARDGLTKMLAKKNTVRRELDEFARSTMRFIADEDDLGRDCVRFVTETMPRLSGRVVRVGRGGKYENLVDAVAEIRSGDLVLLGAGVHRTSERRGGDRRSWADVAFVGLGAKKTELRGAFQTRRASGSTRCTSTARTHRSSTCAAAAPCTA